MIPDNVLNLSQLQSNFVPFTFVRVMFFHLYLHFTRGRFSVKTNLRKKKLVFSFSYNPPKRSITTNIENIVEIIHSISARYRSSFLIGEFNNTEFDIF